MDRKMIYRKTLHFGNKEIAYLTTRAMTPLKDRDRITIDEIRLKNELHLYKYNTEKGSPSLLSSLIPIIVVNNSFGSSLEEALRLLQMIRKKTTLQNKIGVNLLCHYLYHLDDFEKRFSEFKLHDAAKEEEVAFQKEKIAIIMKQKSAMESIVEGLEESDEGSNRELLESLRIEQEIPADTMMEKMESYLGKMSDFLVAPKPLNGSFDLQSVFAVSVGQSGADPLLGGFKVLSKTQDSICIETKRGRIALALPNKEGMDQRPVSGQARSGSAIYAEPDPGDILQRFGLDRLDKSWQKILKEELEEEYFRGLLQKVDTSYRTQRIFPKQQQVFRALQEVPYDKVRVVILGQDPYHGAGQANGLCFSVNEGVKAPPSLVNIFKELEEEYGEKRMKVDLIDWAEQGVLLLNSVLTVQESSPGSHAKWGWERFTDKIIESLSLREEPIVFILWGNYAISKAKNVDLKKHHVLRSAHPSPLSCRNFFGNKHFISANRFLKERNRPEIKWI